jgi:hypothetical protein
MRLGVGADFLILTKLQLGIVLSSNTISLVTEIRRLLTMEDRTQQENTIRIVKQVKEMSACGVSTLLVKHNKKQSK